MNHSSDRQIWERDVGEPVSAAEFDSLFHNFAVEAWRLETRDAYAMSYEREDYERFLSGGPFVEPPDMEWFKPWQDLAVRHSTPGEGFAAT